MAGVPRGKPKEPVSAEAARIGEILRQRRLSPAVNKRQEDVALDAGIVQKTLSQIERGETDFMRSGLENAYAILKALGWTFTDFQRATGVDLGMTEAVLVGEGSADVYPLQSALHPDRPATALGHDLVAPGIQRPLLLQADTEEMVGTSPASIRPGSILHVDQADTTPHEGRVYVITDQDGVHVRLYTVTRLGAVFRAENRGHEDIPAKDANIVGLVAAVASDYDPNLN